jgi:hypothetical protein
MPDPVPSLEAASRARLAAARTIGWFFSGGEPDTSTGTDVSPGAQTEG